VSAPRGRDGLVEIEGFGEIVERAEPVRGRGRGDVGERAHDDDRHACIASGNAFEQREAARTRHAHIGEQHVGLCGGEGLRGLFGVGEVARREAGFAQRGGKHDAHGAIVLDDPCHRRRRGRAHSDTGSSSVNTVAPGRLA
jgi:hypothetical protein